MKKREKRQNFAKNGIKKRFELNFCSTFDRSQK